MGKTASRESTVREFSDESGTPWLAEVKERSGLDFKGRFYFFLKPAEGSEEDGVALLDVRWNSLKTAERTLRTMSPVELRRRLRSARGRSRTPSSPALRAEPE